MVLHNMSSLADVPILFMQDETMLSLSFLNELTTVKNPEMNDCIELYGLITDFNFPLKLYSRLLIELR